MRYSKKVDEANIRIIDLKLAVLDEIEPLVDEDRYKFNLAQNSRLLKNFIFYRLSDFVLAICVGVHGGNFTAINLVEQVGALVIYSLIVLFEYVS